MTNQVGNIKVDHEVLEKQARDLAALRERLNTVLRNCHGEMETVSDAMRSDAGERLIGRFNNLVQTFFGRYADSMADHANYLYDTAVRYREEDAKLKEKANSALRSFDEV